MLHLVFQELNPAILARIGSGDDVIFMENALFGLLSHGRFSDELTALRSRCRLYALADDLRTRGIAPEDMVAGIEAIDDAGWVGLAVKHPQIQSWF